MSFLEVKDLRIYYETNERTFKAVNGLDFHLEKGEILGLVGETGAGKTTTCLGIMRLVPNPPGKITSGTILFEGKNLLDLSEKEMKRIRGNSISMIFQDPMTALNPIIKVGDQIAESLRLHMGYSRAEATVQAVKMLEKVGIPGERYDDYPHQFSGGMKQRVVIAMALACHPKLLLADEPTTALDVTIQAQVLNMIKQLKEELNTSMLLITHDLGIVAENCDRVAIMYAGEIVESGSLDDVFNHTAHPYTQGLIDSLPSLDKEVHRLKPIKGLMPDPSELPEGCCFHPRCPKAREACKRTHPAIQETAPGHAVRCLFASGGETTNE